MNLNDLSENELDGQPCAHKCHSCIKKFDIRCGFLNLPLSSARYIFCPECGNKRCPKASDHRLACTDSNEPGQAGSVYT